MASEAAPNGHRDLLTKALLATVSACSLLAAGVGWLVRDAIQTTRLDVVALRQELHSAHPTREWRERTDTRVSALEEYSQKHTAETAPIIEEFRALQRQAGTDRTQILRQLADHDRKLGSVLTILTSAARD